MKRGFVVEAQRKGARRALLRTPHGEIHTPVFMPVGTAATVKGVPQGALEELGAEILLANTYHLYLRPGVPTIENHGGLHRFMAWPRALLTDSGGYQVFSLSELRRVTADGVTFRSHLDGSSHFLSPETSVAAQIRLGADIIMALDECTEYPAEPERTRASMERTLAWARRSKEHFERHKREVPGHRSDAPGEGRGPEEQLDRQAQMLFGIVQGGMDAELRKQSAERTVEIGFDGYAIGGLSVGEPRELTRAMVESTLEHLPPDQPRYLMGVGTPDEIVEYARLGIDMMDCVLPTRAARHGLLYTSEGKISIKQARYTGDQGPLDARCGCGVCRRYSRAYLRHLYASNELLAQVLNTIHNLSFYLDTMRSLRHSI